MPVRRILCNQLQSTGFAGIETFTHTHTCISIHHEHLHRVSPKQEDAVRISREFREQKHSISLNPSGYTSIAVVCI